MWTIFQEENRKLSSHLRLKTGSRVGVIGGGPAGAFFSYFLLDMAERLDFKIKVDLYEPKDFTAYGPQGCNKCGGIISESLVQHLATEGIIMPSNIIQRGIDSYVMHTDVGSVRIETPLHEKRIGAVYRGSGPRGTQSQTSESFDGFLLNKAKQKGAEVIKARVTSIEIVNTFPQIEFTNITKSSQTYDLVAVATGINTPSISNLDKISSRYRPPTKSRTFIREYRLGYALVEQYLGNSMHVFLLKIPCLQFAAIIPKGDFATICMLGENIDNEVVSQFMNSTQVKECFPADYQLRGGSCQCWPSINTRGAYRPFRDRLVFIGDSGYTRLYKDGIGAAYITAKAAASTAILQGISSEHFRRHYWPICKRIDTDNRFGKCLFFSTRVFKYLRCTRRAMFKMICAEQKNEQGRKIMSTVLWDMFTGSSAYRDIVINALRPSIVGRLAWNAAVSLVHFLGAHDQGEL